MSCHCRRTPAWDVSSPRAASRVVREPGLAAGQTAEGPPALPPRGTQTAWVGGHSRKEQHTKKMDNSTLVFPVSAKVNKPWIKHSLKNPHNIDMAETDILIRLDGTYIHLALDSGDLVLPAGSSLVFKPFHLCIGLFPKTF